MRRYVCKSYKIAEDWDYTIGAIFRLFKKHVYYIVNLPEDLILIE